MANDLLSGQMIATISDNGGKVRVTFAADDLDAEFVALLTTSHYIYNVTRNENSLITSVSGDEDTGFIFDTALNTAGTTWATGDSCTPCRSNTKLQYSTNALARAGASAGDTVLVGYAVVARRVVMTDYPGTIGVQLHWWGLLAKMRIHVQGAGNASCFYYSAIFSGVGQSEIRNITMDAGYAGLRYVDSSSPATGGGVWADRCRISGGQGTAGYGIYFHTGAATGEVIKVTRCEIFGCVMGIRVTAGTVAMYNTTIYDCQFGVYNANIASIYKNVASLFCVFDWYQLTNATVTYCADTDGSLPVATGNLLALTKAQCAIWKHHDGGFYLGGGRILATSSMYGTGDYQAGQPATDIDRTSITTGCPIGCHKGTTNAFGRTWPAASNVLAGSGAYVSWAGTQTPSSDKLYSAAEEAARNIDPGEAYVLREADGGPSSYKILDVTKTPAYAPDFPAVANVASDDTVNGSPGTMDLPALNKVAPSDTLRGSAGTLDLPALNKVAPSDTIEGVAGTLDLPAINKVAPSDTLEGVTGTLDLPAINKVAPSDTLEGVTGTLDLPALNKVAPSDTLEGVSGTLDLPAINKVAPSDTLEGVTGTLDLPALNKVAPSDTLEGAAGTLDLPALNKVAPSDTLEGVAGTIDLPALSSVDPLDTLEGVAGTMDVPELSSVLDSDTLRGEVGTATSGETTTSQTNTGIRRTRTGVR